MDVGATPAERSRACQRVLDALGAGRSAVVVGDDGVGVARLLEEVASAATEDGWIVMSLRAAGRDVPLAALDGLLTRSTGTAILDHAIALVAAVRATGERVVALVDDAALLDEVSAAVLHEAASCGVPVVLATRRAERLPDVLRRLDLVNVDLGGLSRADRRRRRAVVQLQALDDLDRRAIEVLAVAEGPVGATLVADLIGSDVATIVAHHLVIGDRRERRIDLRVVHHLHAEVTLATMDDDAIAARRRELADAIAATGARRPDDALRIAILCSATGDEAAVADVVAAAWELLHAHRDAKLRPFDVPEVIADALAEAARHLARRALDWGGRTAALEVLVRSLERLDRAGEARDLVEHADRYVVDTDDEVRAASLRARAAARDGRDERATAALDGELHDATPEHRARLLRARLDVLVLGGRSREAVADGDELLAAGPLTARVAAPYGLALAQCGRAGDALAQVDPILATRDGVDHDAIGLAALARIAALADLGRLDDATALAGLLVALADATDEVGFQAACRLAGAMVAWAAGRPAEAAELADAATSRFESVDFFGLSGGTLGVAAASHAQLGDLMAARARLRAAESTSAQPRAYQHTIAHGRAWWLLAEGHHDRAVHELEEIAIDRRRVGGVSSEVLVLHDLVRIGEPARAIGRLSALAVWVQGPLARLAADHANALLARNADALDVVAARALDHGMRLVAADAAAQAARAHEQRGDSARAERSRRHSEALVAECGGAFTPATATAPSSRRRRRET